MENNTSIITGNAGGNHVVDGPLTTTAMREGSPSLVLNEIDRRIVRVRPMSTPVDQISRMIGARQASSMVVDYYSVDTKPVQGTVAAAPAAVKGATYSGLPVFLLHTDNDSMFAATETLLIPDTLECGDASKPDSYLVLYVVEGAASGAGLKVIALNHKADDPAAIPAIEEGTSIVRMGRAASELDVQTPQFEALPVKSSNYCQIFKAQVEQSAFAKLSAKEVGWTFSDQEEVAIMDMRMGMEKNFLFGVKARLTDPKNYDEVLFTGGIWHQAETEIAVSLNGFGQDSLLAMMRSAFTGDCAGSSRKILVAGSDLIQAINAMDYTKMISASDTVTRWGIDFNEVRSKFGTLYVIHSEIFDQCGHAADGMIIDPQYLTKYTHVPFKVEHLDLKKSGVRNTDAIVATEASCLVLRHPKAHVRITGSWE